MKTFNELQIAVQKQFKKLEKMSTLFKVDVDRDTIIELYLDSFDSKHNKIFRKRREYDCSCCKSFIRQAGGVIAIDSNYEVHTLWDIPNAGIFQKSVDALAKYIKSLTPSSLFLHYENKVGTVNNLEQLLDGNILTWDHFFLDLPSSVVKPKDSIRKINGKFKNNLKVITRLLNETSLENISIVKELVDQEALYRSNDYKFSVNKAYEAIKNTPNDVYMYALTLALDDNLASFRNSSIGQLIVNLDEGIDLETAVGKFEAMVAPTDYKRPKSLITKAMVEDAEKTIKELGLEPSLYRRLANKDDLTVNNVLFVDNEVTNSDNTLFSILKDDVKTNIPKLDSIEEISIDKFISKILPTVNKMELLVENKHTNNFFSLIAPVNPTAKLLTKWNNNFSWTYNGNVTDSIKENVSKAGGNIVADMRFSIQWNENGDNLDDLDAHCLTPDGHIYFRSKKSVTTKGFLDIDITNPKGVAVENIAFKNKGHLLTGSYKFRVHNYCSRGGVSGFNAQIEVDKEIFEYNYPTRIPNKAFVDIATVKWDGTKFEITHHLDTSSPTKNIWGISTNKFTKVDIMMLSPNYWDNNQIGNKHYFFVLENCKVEDKVRGFFNEYLPNSLNKHRKVLEVLGNKLMAEPVDSQLSGIGFSSTVRNSVVVKCYGNTKRIFKINF